MEIIYNLLRRIGYSILVIWGVVSVIFFLFNILPGDPARMILGQRADLANVEIIRKELGLDKPVYLQYFRYLNDLSPISFHNKIDEQSYFYFDKEKYGRSVMLIQLKSGLVTVIKFPWLGRSFQSKRPTAEMILEALPNSIILALSSIFLALLFGVILGIYAALKKNSWYDSFILFFSAIGMSLPSFFAAILMAWFFAYKIGHLTHLNLTGNLYEIDDLGRGMKLQLKNLILPAITLGIRPLSVVVQLSRNSLLEVLSQDYIRTAFAKGLSFTRIILVHALRNALNPVITAISGWFASMLAGVVFVEYIFGWRGLGYLIVNALNLYDLPVVLSVVITIAVLFVIVNIVVDFIYTILDPRLRK